MSDDSETKEFTGETSDKVRLVVRIGAPALAILIGFLTYRIGGLPSPAAITLGVAIWTALWWIFEAVPIAVTSLIPLALLPLFGVMSKKAVAEAFGNELVLLLMGGFLLSKAMEKSGTHRRIALIMVNFCPSSGRFVVLGFMIATAFLSMWISNTATTLMMLPIAIAVMQNCNDSRIKIPLLLGIAYAANVGGIGTPIGTPPNLVMIGAYKELGFPEITFTEWMKFGVPVSVLMVIAIWLWLTRSMKGIGRIPLPDPGKWRPEEVRTLIVFALTALAWITRSEPFGGWSSWLSLPGANDSIVAFLAVIALFCISSGEVKGEKLLDWKTANTIPWGLLILVGSGLCLGEGFQQSGLSNTIAKVFSGLENVPLIWLLIMVSLVVTFLTEMTSNTATTNVLMPILGAAATASGIDPKLLMIPAALSASCAFMLPVATMPNAVVFGTGEVSVRKMAMEGFVLNLIGAAVITIICFILLR